MPHTPPLLSCESRNWKLGPKKSGMPNYGIERFDVKETVLAMVTSDCSMLIQSHFRLLLGLQIRLVMSEPVAGIKVYR